MRGISCLGITINSFTQFSFPGAALPLWIIVTMGKGTENFSGICQIENNCQNNKKNIRPKQFCYMYALLILNIIHIHGSFVKLFYDAFQCKTYFDFLLWIQMLSNFSWVKSVSWYFLWLHLQEVVFFCPKHFIYFSNWSVFYSRVNKFCLLSI